MADGLRMEVRIMSKYTEDKEHMDEIAERLSQRQDMARQIHLLDSRCDRTHT